MKRDRVGVKLIMENAGLKRDNDSLRAELAKVRGLVHKGGEQIRIDALEDYECQKCWEEKVAELKTELAKVRTGLEAMNRVHDTDVLESSRLSDELAKVRGDLDRVRAKGTPHKCPICEGTGQLQHRTGTAINIQPCHGCINGILWDSDDSAEIERLTLDLDVVRSQLSDAQKENERLRGKNEQV